MFFKRASKNNIPKPALGSVQTIPEIFYGGSDPEALLHGAGASKIVKPNTVTASSGQTSSQGNTKAIAVLMITIFLVVSGGAAWAYWKYLGGGTESAVVTKPTETVPVEEKIVETTSTEAVLLETTSTTAMVTSTEIVAATTTLPVNNNLAISELSIDFPALNQLTATDFDSDTLTDAEEETFGTDQSVFDTDKDGYSDGQEVLNLYNPKGNNPVRLAESGLVREFTHPKDVYRLYYPISWQAGSVDAVSNTMLFTAANGDYIEARIVSKNNGEDFATWFARTAKDQQIIDLQTSTNDFKTSYYARKDGLVVYVELPNHVLVILYHPLVNSPINYRTTLQMILGSLRVVGAVNQAGL